MTFVVTEKCILCKYTDCVEVCPVDCFHEGPTCLVIDPDECIDCALCEPECPIEAICSDDSIHDSSRNMVEINTKFSKKWPSIVSKKEPLSEAEKWKDIRDKLKYFKDV